MYYAAASSFTEAAILYRTVIIKNPRDHIPTDIKTSGTVGQYSKTLLKGLGMKPPTIRPNPLSIHVAMITDPQATARNPSFLRRPGMIRRTRDMKAKTTAIHIMGTSFP